MRIGFPSASELDQTPDPSRISSGFLCSLAQLLRIVGPDTFKISSAIFIFLGSCKIRHLNRLCFTVPDNLRSYRAQSSFPSYVYSPFLLYSFGSRRCGGSAVILHSVPYLGEKVLFSLTTVLFWNFIIIFLFSNSNRSRNFGLTDSLLRRRSRC
jgi:hypothetical protein